MALALKPLTAVLTGGGIIDDIMSFGNGVLDGYTLVGVGGGVWIVLVKDVLILAVDKMVMPLPKGIVHSAESVLGFILGVLLAPRR